MKIRIKCKSEDCILVEIVGEDMSWAEICDEALIAAESGYWTTSWVETEFEEVE